MNELLQDWLREQLFEQVPCSIAVIGRDYSIVDHNRKFQELFGPGRGKLCHMVYKKRKKPCEQCIASKTFADGKYRVNDEIGIDCNGRTAHYLVHVAPIFDPDGEIPYIIEMSTDITGVKRLQSEYQVLFEKVPCYISILNRDYRVVRANELMQQTFGATTGQHCWEVYKRRDEKCENCPAEMSFGDGETHSREQIGVDKNGDKTHYVVTSSPLHQSDSVTHVIEMAVDVTRIRQLEREKIEAERLAAVGQTVAGLAHSIKNILAGLEGGMYIFQTGLDRNERARIDKGWDMLNRNINKISDLAKNLLSFSRGDVPEVGMVDPKALVNDMVELFEESAGKHGIGIATEVEEGIEQAPMDYEAIHTCLANLVTNALDACQVSEKEDCKVTIRLFERDNAIVFEVEDQGMGMEYEVKQKVFTNFFTTKGKSGTGVGLLLTRKIVQEHGGSVSFDSIPGEGAVFKLSFPRDRLPQLSEEKTGEKAGEKSGDEGDRPEAGPLEAGDGT